MKKVIISYLLMTPSRESVGWISGCTQEDTAAWDVRDPGLGVLQTALTFQLVLMFCLTLLDTSPTSPLATHKIGASAYLMTLTGSFKAKVAAGPLGKGLFLGGLVVEESASDTVGTEGTVDLGLGLAILL